MMTATECGNKVKTSKARVGHESEIGCWNLALDLTR